MVGDEAKTLFVKDFTKMLIRKEPPNMVETRKRKIILILEIKQDFSDLFLSWEVEVFYT